MHFYESAYGYTLLRLLVYCTLFTEIILFIPTILYILDKKVNLSKSYLTIIMIIYICMNFANFDNIIATRNVNRYIETGKIDLHYLKNSTGSDAINPIITILKAPGKHNEIQVETITYLKDVYKSLSKEKMDFRNLNLSKIYAKKLIEKKLNLNNN